MTTLRQTGLTLFLGFLSLAGGVLAWRQHLELVALRQTGDAGDDAELRRQLAASRARVRALEDQLAALRAGSANAPADDSAAAGADAARGAGGSPSGRAGGFPGGRGGRGAEIRAVLDNPAAQRLIQQQQRLALDGRYAPLFRNLNLPADKLDQLKTLLLEKQTAMQDVFAAAETQGLDPRSNRDEMRQLIASTQSEIDGNLKSLLGTDGFAQYEKFQQTQPQRNLVNQLQQSLSYTANPLTTAQAEQLVDVFATTTTTLNPPGGARGGGEFGGPPPEGGRGGFGGGFGGGPQGSATLTPAAITAAQAVLSASQVEALVQIQQTQQAQQQLNQMMRAGRGSDPSPRRGG